MRILAAVIVFLLCTAEGLRRRFALKSRAELLDGVLVMLNNFSVEISCRALTPDELIQNAKDSSFAKAVREKRSELPNIRAAWEAACKELPKNRERELLSELGRSLGTSDKSGQMQLLNLYSAEISRLKEEAWESYRKKGEAFSRVGMLCGAAAAVLIL